METRVAIAERWSPRAYQPEPVPEKVLEQIWEASHSGHSCFNEQPWRFLYATHNAGAPRRALEALLDDGNAYAKSAWVLGVSFGKKTFTKTGAPNRHNGHDVGSASQLMSLQAFSLGYGMRFMAGYNLEEARKLAPSDFEPYAMFVIGVPEAGLPAPVRTRNPLRETVFENTWGEPSPLV